MEKAHLNQTQKESGTRENRYHADKEELVNIQIRAFQNTWKNAEKEGFKYYEGGMYDVVVFFRRFS
ncbi:MAG TPA: hypothetical protein D7I06_03070 [Candidatus Poseidoniales archaeon]|nr:MAG TPA: hypothetical protein D7I06_03070 [Candidatus Poseidoniales archaeon]HII62571.1 hypothetical protein [Candidatus Poseidoniaceae archaeon]